MSDFIRNEDIERLRVLAYLAIAPRVSGLRSADVTAFRSGGGVNPTVAVQLRLCSAPYKEFSELVTRMIVDGTATATQHSWEELIDAVRGVPIDDARAQFHEWIAPRDLKDLLPKAK